ncbi:MAG: hypothetical protein ABIQ33_14305 [Caldimonas sp.]
MAQTLIVVLLVLACSLRAAWILAPAAARRAVARVLLAWPLPGVLSAPLRKHARAAKAGCACDGCDVAPANASPAAAGVAPITFHRRPPR